MPSSSTLTPWLVLCGTIVNTVVIIIILITFFLNIPVSPAYKPFSYPQITENQSHYLILIAKEGPQEDSSQGRRRTREEWDHVVTKINIRTRITIRINSQTLSGSNIVDMSKGYSHWVTSVWWLQLLAQQLSLNKPSGSICWISLMKL